MPEVGGAVHGRQPEPSDAAQCERGPELDGAVTAEDDRQVPGAYVVLDAVGELAGVRGDRGGVEDAVALPPVAPVVTRRYDDPALQRAQPLHDPLLAQGAA